MRDGREGTAAPDSVIWTAKGLLQASGAHPAACTANDTSRHWPPMEGRSGPHMPCPFMAMRGVC